MELLWEKCLLCVHTSTQILRNASASTKGSLFASDCAQTGTETAEAAMYEAKLSYNPNPCTFQAVVMLRDAVKPNQNITDQPFSG